MAVLRLHVLELAYFYLRLVLSVVAAIATVMIFRYGWRSRRDGRQWVLPMLGGALLLTATCLSVYDAIDNTILRPHDPITLASWLWFPLVDFAMPILAVLVVRAREQRDHLLHLLAWQNVTDQLTGVLNRRGFFEQAAASVARARRTGDATAMIIFDIDHFKAINDGWGHPAGDKVLQAVGTALTIERRAGDIVGRLGGEEFALLVYGSTVETAVTVAERLRLEMRRSLAEPETAVSLAMSTADAALYQAKRSGRDRIASALTCSVPPLEPC